ncbi:uncharacterized protein JCM6883_003912 [Sporobolomyces salmoneus]|uniref:uncharacterized protein n=1 Tax=Sporobolomyces salmoneus TaxID=183962 RepID=UPI00317F59CF
MRCTDLIPSTLAARPFAATARIRKGRQRHKKCSETKNSSGACERCFMGSWECVWPVPPGEKPLKTFKRKGKTSTAGSNAEEGSGEEGEGGKRNRRGRRGSSSASGYGGSANFEQYPQLPPAPTTYSLPYSIPALQPLPPPGPLPLPSVPNQPNTDLNDFFESLDQELAYWQTIGQDTHDSGASSEFTTMPMPNDPDAELPMQSAPSFLPPQLPLPPVSEPVASTSAQTLDDPLPVPPQQEQPQETTSSSTSDEPDVVDPVYNAFNEGFFRSLPKPVRDIVVKRIYGLANSHELSRNASMAMVMLYRLRMQSSSDENPEASAEAQARLLAQSDKYFQAAMEHLQKPIPFEAKLVATLDLQAYQFDQFGAAASNAILLLMEYFIHESLGSQPALDLSAIRSSVDVLYVAFAFTDAIRCICIPKRRTVFAFSNLPGETSASSPSTVLADVNTSETPSIETHLGLPVGLLLCIAATANLSAEMEALPDEVVKFKGDAIEKAIRSWRPTALDTGNNDSASYIEKLATAEMWRHACILFLYQAVFRHGSLSLVVRSALQQILQIGARVLNNHPIQTSSIPLRASESGARHAPDPSYEDYFNACSTRAVPWFLAATVAVLPNDRELCKKGLSICGKQKGYQDNLDAVERIWEVVDTQGWTVDWRALVQSEKRFVGFL